MYESYNKQNAAKYGVKAAVILEKLIYFTASNIIKGEGQHEGETYVNIKNGARGFAELMEYSPRQIAYNLDKLEKADAIQKTNAYNRNKYDRTQLIKVNKLLFENQILQKVKEIQTAKSIKATTRPAAPRAATEPKPKAAREASHKAAPMENRPKAEPKAEPPQLTEETRVIYEIYKLHFKKLFKNPPPPLNHHTAEAAGKIYNYILKDIQTKTGQEQHEKQAILIQIEWHFFAASYLFKDQLLKYNLIYLEKAGERITATMETLANQHYNKNHKYKRQFFINLNNI